VKLQGAVDRLGQHCDPVFVTLSFADGDFAPFEVNVQVFYPVGWGSV